MTGVDPAVKWRGLYSTAEGAQAMLQGEGGIIATFRYAASVAGLQRTRLPGPGAVGVVAVPACDGGAMGGICVAPGFWSTVAPQGGIVVTAARVIAAWEIPHGRGRSVSDRDR